jgi:hypothetical protein
LDLAALLTQTATIIISRHPSVSHDLVGDDVGVPNVRPAGFN